MPNYTKTYIFLLLCTAVFFSGCSSDDGGSGGTASVPTNAVVINETNAEPTIASAVSTSDLATLAFGVSATPNANLKNALDLIEQIRANAGITNSNLATGVTETYPCADSGNLTWSGTETATSDSGTISFNNCNELGYVFTGSLKYSSTWNDTTGDYSDTASGSFSMDSASQGFKFSFSGLDYAENGNEFNYTYTVTKATFSINFVYNGTGNDGFLTKLTAPIVESAVDYYYGCPESGTILITGANGTTAEGIYNGDGYMTIKANDVVVTTTASCYY